MVINIRFFLILYHTLESESCLLNTDYYLYSNLLNGLLFWGSLHLFLSNKIK